MKLNVDIIFQNLKKKLPVTLWGKGSDDLSLIRPEFYLDDTDSFCSDHVYVCSADHLPRTFTMEKNVLLICLGDAPQLASYKKACCVISMPEDLNIFEVFNTVQEVFNRYAGWEEKISAIARQSASLQDLLDASRDIFENPMLLNGADFNYLAYTDRDYLTNNLGLKFDTPSFDADTMATFLSLHEIATDISEPLLLHLMGRSTLSVNIFDMDEYLGCITVFGEYRALRSSDTALCVYFAQILKQALQRTPSLAGDRSSLRAAMQAILDGQPISPEQRQLISRRNQKGDLICACFMPDKGRTALPGGYISSLTEQSFANSLAFEYRGSVCAFLSADVRGGSDVKAEIEGFLSAFLRKTQMKCGVSQSFEDLYDAGFSFFQASSALKIGSAKNSAGTLFFFEDFILNKLIEGAFSDIPVRFFYSSGLAKLKKHDLHSQVSYTETLKTFLDNNMSLSKTAEKLYIHRSSLIDRLSRIIELTEFNLYDPDTRLELSLILRAEELL